ncbi:MAG: pyruvate kinase [Bacteroidia bacterium]|nr:pyruvate kinase [Bacteroidia bacterium]
MPATFNRTKIVATLGPATDAPEVLQQMLEAGVDVCRLNMSHGDHASHAPRIAAIRALNQALGTNVAILCDLQGPKIRVGDLEAPVPIARGQEVVFDTQIRALTDGRIPMQLESFARDVKPGELVLVEDGKVELRVVATDGQHCVTLRVENGTTIGSRKGVNLPDTQVSVPSLTEKDLRDLDFALAQGADWVALSFVRSPDDIHQLRARLEAAQATARIIAKIEKPEALRNLDAIIAATDGVMVARGDLGVEIATEDVPFWQKQIVYACNQAGKPVIVATQMLESMIENPRPTRAEATDVANAVLDGADAVMVSGETSVGKHPVRVIETLQRILARAESRPEIYHPQVKIPWESPTFHADAVCKTAAKLARGIGAKAICSMTHSGYTAFQISRHRPEASIFIFSSNRALLTQLSLVWGVRCLYYDRFVGTHETIEDTVAILKANGLVAVGDVVVSTASIPLQARGRTNMVKFTVVE